MIPWFLMLGIPLLLERGEGQAFVSHYLAASKAALLEFFPFYAFLSMPVRIPCKWQLSIFFVERR